MNLLYAAHVLTALLFLGPIAVAVSMFGPTALSAHNGSTSSTGQAQLLHRITRVYGLLSLLVPALGVAAWVFAYPELMKNGVYHVSVLLSVVAWAVLFFLILPRQRAMLAGLGALDEGEKPAKPVADWQRAKGQMAMISGIFNALWLVVAVLMVVG